MNKQLCNINWCQYKFTTVGRLFWKSHYINNIGLDNQLEYDNICPNPSKLKTIIFFKKF